MSFVLYDLTFLAFFTLVTALFLYRKRANLQREGLLYLYRTKVGLKVIEYTSTKFAWLLRPLQYLVVACGYVLMASMVWFLAKFTYVYTLSEPLVRATKLPPIVPLVPYLPEIFKVDFLPPFYFTYWIVIIAIIAVSHEFAHGIFARLNNVKVKSTGFGFFGPFLAAFVEPDDKQMQKKSKFVQLSVLAAGTFANILMTILFGLIFWLFFVSSFTPAGVNFNSYGITEINLSAATMINGMAFASFNPSTLNASFADISIGSTHYFASGTSVALALEQDQDRIIAYENSPAFRTKLEGPITHIDDQPVRSLDELRLVLQSKQPGETVTITTFNEGESIDTTMQLGDKEGKAYLGVGVLEPSRKGLSGYIYGFIEKIKDPTVYYMPRWNAELAWFTYNLLWWIVLINLSVALVNMLPLGFFDGGRFFYLTVLGITKNQKVAHRAFSISTWIIFGIAIWLTLRWAIAIF